MFHNITDPKHYVPRTALGILDKKCDEHYEGFVGNVEMKKAGEETILEKLREKTWKKPPRGRLLYVQKSRKAGVIGQPNIFGRALYMTRITVFGSCQPLA